MSRDRITTSKAGILPAWNVESQQEDTKPAVVPAVMETGAVTETEWDNLTQLGFGRIER